MVSKFVESTFDIFQQLEDFSGQQSSRRATWINADPETLPRYQRPFQAANRNLCNRFGATASTLADVGIVPAQQIADQCRPYLTSQGFSTPAPAGTGVRYWLQGTFLNAQNQPQTQTAEPTNPAGYLDAGPGRTLSAGSFITIGSDGQNYFGYSLLPGGGQFNAGWRETPSLASRVLTGQGGPLVTGPNPPPNPPPTFTYDYGDGSSTVVSVGAIEVNAEGQLSIPVDVGGVQIDLGGTPDRSSTNPPRFVPDFDNPSEPFLPDQPPATDDDLDLTVPLICFQVVITQEPPGASAEIGGEENLFLEGFSTDAGWARFKIGAGFSPPYRITGRNLVLCYCCGDVIPSGLQVKFSFGFSGFVVVYPIVEE